MKKHLMPLSIIVLLWGYITYAMYVPHMWLSGWDTIHAELDIILNLKRSISAVWQEYQGTGLMGGMGHAADLPRQALFAMLSPITPPALLRFGWTMSMFLLGSVGVYALLYTILKSIYIHNTKKIPYYSLIGSLFYALNLATVQTFFAPYEAFVAHFGGLPWLLTGTLLFLQKPSKKHLIVFIMLQLLFMSQSYVPTLFLVYMITTTVVVLGQLMLHHTKEVLHSIVLLYSTILLVNAFWLMPFMYNTVTHGSVIVNGKINQMATEENFLKNQKYGTIVDTLTLKNFWFDTTDYYPTEGHTALMLQTWKAHTDSPGVSLALGILSGLIVIGALIALKQKQGRVWVGVTLLGFTMLASQVPPFEQIVQFLRSHVPLLSQFFRFPFTKWGIEIAVGYSVLIGIGIAYIFESIHIKNKVELFVLFALFSFPILIVGYPMLRGTLIDKHMFVSFPKEYTDVYAYFSHQPLGRIANLPQASFWDWKYYKWGQFGSGFLWYGIEQPMLDRAFDVWGKENEQYYWEISRALYSKNVTQVERVLSKYSVDYILVDENVTTAGNYKSLLFEDIFSILSQSALYKIDARFKTIAIYKRITPQHNSFISLYTEIPNVLPIPQWLDTDAAYGEIGPYLSDETKGIPDRFYPFRSLFTKRSAQEREFIVEESDDIFTLTSHSIATSAGISLDQPVYDSAKTNDLDPKKVAVCGPLYTGSIKTTVSIKNTIAATRFESINQKSCLSFTIPTLSLHDGYIIRIESDHTSGRPMRFAAINDTVRHTEIETYLSTDSTSSYFILPPLATDGLGYSLYFANDSIGSVPTVNTINRIQIFAFPYDQLTSQSTQKEREENSFLYMPITVNHPNPAYYAVRIDAKQDNQTLVLSQSFDDGWIALTQSKSFPYLKQVGNHVLVNNWENGFLLRPEEFGTKQDKGQITIYLFFWPQLLEWVGFLLLPIPFLLAQRIHTRHE